MNAAIEVRGLEKRYGSRVAVAGIDLRIAAGEIFGLLGPNGAGKTTTVEILEGYRRADAGAVRVLGLDPARDAAALAPRVGVMLQEGGLYPGVRPQELLRVFAAFYEDPEDPESLLDRVGLGDAAGTMVRRLSGGQAQRLSLAVALVGRPELVFLDEPTAGMDPRARADTWQLVRELRDRGTTVLLTTHFMDEAEQLCDRLAIIDRGHLVVEGTPAEVTTSAAHPGVRFRTAAAIDADAATRALGVEVRALGPGEYLVATAPTPGVVATLAAHLESVGVQLVELDTGRASLEQVFLELTADDERGPAGGPGRRR